MASKTQKKPVQSRAFSHRKSSAQAQVIDIDALMKNPERRKKIFLLFSQKIKKTAKIMAKLALKIIKVVQRRDFVY